jgi:hypothetical protein
VVGLVLRAAIDRRRREHVFRGVHGATTRRLEVEGPEDDGQPVAYRVIAIARGTAAERAGFEVEDLISITDVERYVREQRPDVSYRFEVVHAGVVRPAHSRSTATTGITGVGARAATVGGHGGLDGALGARGILLSPGLGTARLAGRAAVCADRVLHGGHWSVRSVRPGNRAILRDLPLPVGVLVLLAMSLSATIPAGAFGFCAVFQRRFR